MVFSIIWTIVYVSSLIVGSLQRNFILNGEFEDPLLNYWWADMSVIPSELSSGWLGHYQVLNGSFMNLGTGQCLDLTPRDVGGNINMAGYASQKLSLNVSGIYKISYRSGLFSTGSAPVTSFQLKTFWNGKQVDILDPPSKNTIFVREVEIQVKKGQNILQFVETKFASSSNYGFFLDSISLDIQYAFPEEKQLYEFKGGRLYDFFLRLGSFPRTISGYKFFMFAVDDLWLYAYDSREYSSLISVIFTTIQKLESIKWSILNYYCLLPQFDNEVRISDYSKFSNPKYQEVEQKDGSFARSVTLFCFVTLPQMLVLCLIFWRIFQCIKDYKISVYLRRYCFLPIYIQLVLEPNIPYFTYLFINQIKIFFSFRFSDKMYLSFAVLFMFLAIVSSICFFTLTNQFYEKKTGYFLHSFYRIPKGILYATLRINIRGMIYGVLHSLLFQKYNTLMISLTAVQFAFLIGAFCLQMKIKVELTRSRFVFGFLYHVLFILLNLSLLFEESFAFEEEQKQLALFFQMVVLYLIAADTIILIALDLIPTQFFRISCKNSSQPEKNSKNCAEEAKNDNIFNFEYEETSNKNEFVQNVSQKQEVASCYLSQKVEGFNKKGSSKQAGDKYSENLSQKGQIISQIRQNKFSWQIKRKSNIIFHVHNFLSKQQDQPKNEQESQEKSKDKEENRTESKEGRQDEKKMKDKNVKVQKNIEKQMLKRGRLVVRAKRSFVDKIFGQEP